MGITLFAAAAATAGQPPIFLVVGVVTIRIVVIAQHGEVCVVTEAREVVQDWLHPPQRHHEHCNMGDREEGEPRRPSAPELSAHLPKDRPEAAPSRGLLQTEIRGGGGALVTDLTGQRL